MRFCRICGCNLGEEAYQSPAPALTSIMTLIEMPTRIYVCDSCGHAQKDDLPDLKAFYDTGYRISLNSEDHDQVFSVAPDGTLVYRTDHQAALSLEALDLPEGSSVLDYGAAKADTLKKIHQARPDIRPHVFDISADYQAAWQSWVSPDGQATYAVPESWRGSFDAAMSHFVIEHVADPISFIRSIGELLRPGGRLLLSMPNVAGNPGDMMVADHLNHFSEASLMFALAQAGFVTDKIDVTSFPGAYFVTASKSDQSSVSKIEEASISHAVAEAHNICAFWKKASGKLERHVKQCVGKNAAIYGAGFYGGWIFCQIGRTVKISKFFDRNPGLQNAKFFDVPVLPPEQITDDVDVLFVGLNPLKAGDAIASQPWLQRDGREFIWL